MSNSPTKPKMDLLIDNILSKNFCPTQQDKLSEEDTEFSMPIIGNDGLKTKYRLYKFEKSGKTKPYFHFLLMAMV